MFRKIGLAVVVLVAGVATPTFAQVVVSCPFNPASGDNSSRGFYVTNYPASTLATVTLEMIPFAPGAVTDTLTARSGAFDGPIIGAVTLPFTVGASSQILVYNFGGASVAPGSTITFAHSISGVGVPDWDTGTGPCANIVETNGTTPPLDSLRGNSYGLQIAATAAIATPVVSSAPLLGLLIAAFAVMAGFALRRAR